MCLDAKVDPKMPRMKRKAVSEGNAPDPHDESGSGIPTMAGIYRIFKEGFDKMDKPSENLLGR